MDRLYASKKCSYELCKMLCELGYKSEGNYEIHKMTEDYVYDDDPTHPESFKAGEIRVYEFYYRNNEKSLEEQCFEWVDLQDAADYISDNYLITVVPKFRPKDFFYEVVLFNDSDYKIEEPCTPFVSREEAFEVVLTKIAESIIRQKKARLEGPEEKSEQNWGEIRQNLLKYLEDRILQVESKFEQESCTGCDFEWEEEAVEMLQDLQTCHDFIYLDKVDKEEGKV